MNPISKKDATILQAISNIAKKYFVQKPYLYIVFLITGIIIFLSTCLLIEIPSKNSSTTIPLLSVIFEKGGNA